MRKSKKTVELRAQLLELTLFLEWTRSAHGPIREASTDLPTTLSTGTAGPASPDT